MSTKKLLDWAKQDLESNLMKWWTTHTPDDKNGGFHGIVGYDNTPDTSAPRFIVLTARLLWTYSALYEISKDDRHKALATRAYDYLVKHHHDKEHGGFYAYVSPTGTVTNDRKFTYGNAFAVYGLSEYARVFNSDAAKKLAAETVNIMDTHIWDVEHKGYYETATRDWQYLPNVILIQEDPKNEKTMNTHLHVLEAYANLLRIHDTKPLRSKVRQLLYIMLNKVVNHENWHFNYFQTRDWTPTTPNLSLGHDIEGSWLLYEAAEILNEPEALADTRKVCVNMARAVYDDGIAESGGIYTTYYYKKRQYSQDLSWWEQCEGVIGFLNAYTLTREEKFLTASIAALEFIDKYFIDKKYGGWYAYISQDGQPRPNWHKASPFMCPYHNARMSIELIKRLRG